MQSANENLNQTEGGSLMDFSYQAEDNGKRDSANDFSTNKAAGGGNDFQEATNNDNGTSHTASLIKAATPYFDTDSQRSLHFLAAVYEIMDSIQLFKQKKTVSALSISIKNVDIEGMLKGVLPLCNTQERSFVDKIINIFNMRRMFETYQTISSMMSAFNTNPEDNNTDSYMRQEYQEPKNTPSYGNDVPYYNDYTNTEDDFDYQNSQSTAFQSNSPDYVEAAQMYAEHEKQNAFKGAQINENEDKQSEIKQENQSSSTNNQQMMEMLGSMLTPEQKSTFEAMKMLFDSGLLNT